MEASAALTHRLSGTKLHSCLLYERPNRRHMFKFGLHKPSQGFGGLLASSTANKRRSSLLSVNASETIQGLASEKDVSEKSVVSENLKQIPRNSTFPIGFEALMLDICDETNIAELKMKVGDFEMSLRRNIAPTAAPIHIASTPTPSPPPTKPIVESISATPSTIQEKSSQPSTNPFLNLSRTKASKLAALDGIGTNTYVLVHSPTVGSFHRGRTIKGKKQPPICKEGDMIKEGQTIGYLDQFGTELPVKSDVAGEVIKLLYQEGEPVGYGDPLIAVLPSFHEIKL